MPSMNIFPTIHDNVGVGPGQYRVSGIATVDGVTDPIEWEFFASYSASAAVTNFGVVSAAIAAATARGISVLPSDNKILWGGATLT